MRSQGKTLAEIGAAFGVTRQRVNQVLLALEKRKAAGPKVPERCQRRISGEQGPQPAH
jgi:DNA-directed RNA polymerase sigma subunit (sigma70/sigma32)